MPVQLAGQLLAEQPGPLAYLFAGFLRPTREVTIAEHAVLLQCLARAEERIALAIRIIARQREPLTELAANGQVEDKVY